MQKALVTGGAGFIGSNLVLELINRDKDVTVLDNYFLGTPENLKEVRDQVKIIEGDVTNEKDVKKAIKDVDVIFHQAAMSSSPMHVENPSRGAQVNVVGTVNIFKNALERDIDVVYASTSSMYGGVEIPHSEEKANIPNLYTASKISKEQYGKIYDKLGLRTVGLRYFSVYGPRERAKGQFANIISQFLWEMQKDKKPLIFGNGKQTRDFTYVKDIVQGNLKAYKHGKSGEIYNIGTGKETNFNQIVEMLNDYLKTDIEPEYTERPENYVLRTKADINKAKKDLNYEPNYNLENGLKETIDFYNDSDF